MSECLSHYYPVKYSDGTGECILCPDFCLECHDSTACISCNRSSYRPLLQDNTCVGVCSTGFYLMPLQHTCLKCSPNCIQCSSSTNCTRCLNAYLNPATRACVPACPQQMYANPSDNECHSCEAPCLNCYNSMNCLTCVEGYYYLAEATACLQFCPAHMYTYLDEQTC